MRSIGVVPWSLTSSPMETLRMEFFCLLKQKCKMQNAECKTEGRLREMQNAECKMQNGGSLRSKNIRFDRDKGAMLCPPNLRSVLYLHFFKIQFYNQHFYRLIKPFLRRYRLNILYTVRCDHNSAFCILHSAFNTHKGDTT